MLPIIKIFLQQTVSLHLAACLMELAKPPGIYYQLATFNLFNYTLLQSTMNSIKKKNLTAI